MASDGTSFLPRILSVFYAVFHDNRGTNIVYQVPEGLILTPPVQGLNTSFSSSALKISSPERTNGNSPGTSESRSGETANQSRTSSSSRYSHLANSRDTLGSSFVRSSSANHYLFKFEDISRYLIPPSSLCGRLATFATRRYQIIGFPVELYDEKRYERNFFRYNVCFVFERTADLSCYEPIVRKIGRVLTTCEVCIIQLNTNLNAKSNLFYRKNHHFSAHPRRLIKSMQFSNSSSRISTRIPKRQFQLTSSTRLN